MASNCSFAPTGPNCRRQMFRVTLAQGALAIRNGSLTGTPRFLESPSHPVAPLYDSGRSGGPHPGGPPRAVPAIPTTRTPAMLISELNHAASVSAVYASSSASPHSHARLASGWWLAFVGRASNPLDSDERFLSATSDLLLSQVYPGATECRSSVQVILVSGTKIFPKSILPMSHHV